MPRRLTLEQATTAREVARGRWALAVSELRQSYVQLASLDKLLNARGDHSQGFGNPLDVVLLRHSVANPDESGSLSADVAQVVESTQIVEG